MRAFMEQTNQSIIGQMEKSNQALLQALQNMENSISNHKNNSSNGRDLSSNHSENNSGSSASKVPKPPFLPREDIPREEEGINHPTNSTVDNARAYATLELEIRELITFRKFCEGQRHEIPRRTGLHANKNLKHKVNKVTLSNFDGSEKVTAHAWL